MTVIASLYQQQYQDGRQKPRVWTPEKLWELMTCLEQGHSDRTIARRLDTTAEAVNLARKRYGIQARTSQHHTAREVQRMLGIACSKTVTRWIEQGWLRARKLRRGNHGWWSIPHGWLLDFLDDPDHWHRWEPELITDDRLKLWAERQRGDVRFLSTGQVAERFYVEHSTVHAWIQDGVIPAVRHDNWYIRESDLEGFVPPGQRSKVGRVRKTWTKTEDQTILAMREEGALYREIGRSLDRSSSGVYRRYRKLTGDTSCR